MIRWLSLLLLFASVVPVAAEAWPEGFAEEGACVVCTRRGGEHGTERFVDWREHRDAFYGFCSKPCAEAFDQMPEGYAEPILPRPAPQFRWESLGGGFIETRGPGALLVDFWATWCKPCLAAIPELEALAREFGPQGLRVVGVSIDEKRDTLEKHLRRNPVEYAVVHDGGEDPAWWQFRVPAIPAAFLLNGDGEIVAQWSGTFSAEAAREALQEILGAEPAQRK